MRREDTSRKEARERKKARKAEALAKQNEEVKRLKALKMREIRQRLDTVSKESGLTTEGMGYFPSGRSDLECTVCWTELESLDIEGEWDPAKHDAQMANIYGADANANADEVADVSMAGLYFLSGFTNRPMICRTGNLPGMTKSILLI